MITVQQMAAGRFHQRLFSIAPTLKEPRKRAVAMFHTYLGFFGFLNPIIYYVIARSDDEVGLHFAFYFALSAILAVGYILARTRFVLAAVFLMVGGILAEFVVIAALYPDRLIICMAWAVTCLSLENTLLSPRISLPLVCATTISFAVVHAIHPHQPYPSFVWFWYVSCMYGCMYDVGNMLTDRMFLSDLGLFLALLSLFLFHPSLIPFVSLSSALLLPFPFPLYSSLCYVCV
mmetsp:Transcript_11953/g.19303  ORF Transcript_11953/g.19303 Transcript_11953/m.19303 type:complete len:233 (-) Transcript_11953:25-723(-)